MAQLYPYMHVGILKTMTMGLEHKGFAVKLQLRLQGVRWLTQPNPRGRGRKAPCGDRTHDHTLTERMLYQLS